MESSLAYGQLDKSRLRALLPQRRVGRPSVRESDELTRRIAQAALSEFRDKGFAGASIDRVAAAANVTRMAVYRRYPDKQALFVSVIEEQIDRIESIAEDVCSEAEDPLMALKLTSRAYLGFALSPIAVDLQRILVAEAPSFPDLAKRLISPVPPILSNRLETLIRTCQAANQISRGSAAEWRDVLLRLVAEGPRWEMLVGAAIWSTAAIDRHFAKMWPLFLKLAATTR
jgi:AcrR family transcriptional regulator